MNKFYFEETELVLSGLETKEVGEKLGVSHSTVSNRVRKTLMSLVNDKFGEDAIFEPSIVEARAESEYWLKLIADYKYKMRPSSEVEMDSKEFEMLKEVVRGMISFKGFLTEKEIEGCKEQAKRIIAI